MSSTSFTRRKMRNAIALVFAISAAAAMLEPSPIAFAQTLTLTIDQVAAIQAAVQTAMANIDPALTGAARTQAIQQALAQVASSQIAVNGAAAIGPMISAALAAGVPVAQAVAPVLPAAIASGIPVETAISAIVVGSVAGGGSATVATQAIIAVAALSGVSNNAVGAGLGQAAVQLTLNSPGAATQIAQAIANEGTAGTGQAFSSAVTASGGLQQLANTALQNPTAVTGSTTVTTTTNLTTTSSQQLSASGTTVSCTNPSCN